LDRPQDHQGAATLAARGPEHATGSAHPALEQTTTRRFAMNVAAIQMVSAIAREANLARAHALLAEAASAGAELAVLPEYFCMMGARDTDKLALRETGTRGA